VGYHGEYNESLIATKYNNSAKDTLDPKDPDAPEKEVAAPAEPEEVVKTLDEYLAEKANKSLKVSLPEARKANDSDDAAFKGAVEHQKEDLGDYYVNKVRV
jgi:plasminogen activator inhibitor 1 RNA-binding protein